MNKLHTYMLPIATGAFALMLSPLAETTAIAYSLIAIIVITGIIGLQALAKNNEAANVNDRQIARRLESLNDQIENLVQASTKHTEMLKVQSNEQAKLAQNTEQYIITLVNAADQQSSNLIEQTKQQTIVLSDNLQTVQSHLEVLQQNVTKQIVATEDKVDEGNKVIENVSVLMVKELQRINQNIEELVSMQNTLPIVLDNLQDAITRNQEQLVDDTRNLETQLEALKDLTSTHYEQSSLSHNEVVEKIAQEFTGLSNTVQQETTLLIEQANKTAQDASTQLAKAIEVVANIEKINVELKKYNTTNNDKVDKQLTQLCDISATLLQGIAQLTSSQSAERKQLLSIQKKLISKYAK